MDDNLLFGADVSDIIGNPLVRSTQGFVQHGHVSVFTHTVMVAHYSARLARAWHIKCDIGSLIRGALLHDFFLYDWHTVKVAEIGGLHGYRHPVIAAENARKHFKISDKEYKIILSHMWPLTITRIPTSKEGWLICLIDKYCSILETLRFPVYSNEEVLGKLGITTSE